MLEIQRTIEYDADRVKGFGREVTSVPGCGASEGTAALRCDTLHGPPGSQAYDTVQAVTRV